MRLYSNNASTFLDAAVASQAQATITVSSATGFPTLPSTPGTDYYHITVEDVNGNYEIMRVIAMSGSGNRVFTVLRAQEGSTARVFNTPGTTRVEVRFTAEAAGEFLQREGDTIDGGSDFNGAAATRSVVKLLRNQTGSPGAVPSSLAFGELAVDIQAYKLWVGDWWGTPVEILAKIAVQSGTPSNASAGQFWYNIDTKALKVYYNGAWQDIAVAASVGQDILLANPAGVGTSYSLKASKSDGNPLLLAYLNSDDDVVLGDATSDATYVRGKVVYFYTSVDGSFNPVEGLRLGYTNAPTYSWDMFISNYLTANILAFRGGRASSAVAFQVRDGTGVLRTVTVNVDGTITQDAGVTSNNPTNTLTTRAYVDARYGTGKLIASGRVTSAGTRLSGYGFNVGSFTSGVCTITLSPAGSQANNLVVTATVIHNSPGSAWGAIASIGGPSSITIRTGGGSPYTPLNLDFSLMVWDVAG